MSVSLAWLDKNFVRKPPVRMGLEEPRQPIVSMYVPTSRHFDKCPVTNKAGMCLPSKTCEPTEEESCENPLPTQEMLLILIALLFKLGCTCKKRKPNCSHKRSN